MPVLRTLLEVTIYSSILFLVILLFRAVFKKHASPAMLYAAWLLLVLRLVFPVTVSGLSLIVLPAQEAAVQPPQSGLTALPGNAAGEASISPQTPAASAEEPSDAGSAVTQAGPAAEGTPAAATLSVPWEWDWGTVMITLWITGAVVVLLNMAAAKAALYKRLASAACLPDERHKDALRIQNEMGIRSRIRFAAMRDFDSPALCTSLRPTIIIPMELLWQNGKSIEFALRHEMTHLKRGDHLVCLLLMLLKAIYWFNPAVWLAARLIKMDMEPACDSRVVSAMDGPEKKQYASTVLGMYIQAQQHFVLGMALGHTRQTAERRIRGIFMRQRSARGVKAAALLLAAVMLIACFTTALQPVRAAAPENISTESPEQTAAEITPSENPATTPAATPLIPAQTPMPATSPTPATELTPFPSPSPSPTPSSGEIIVFEDPIVEKVMRNILSRPEGPITDQDMLRVRDFVFDYNSVKAYGGEVKTIDDLRWCVNLRHVVLYDINITDISALSGTRDLIEFQSQKKLKDLTPLLANKNLNKISLTGVTDGLFRELMANCSKLKNVTLDQSEISSETIRMLADRYKLSELRVVMCGITDVSPFAAFTGLEYLSLEYNNIKDISPLAENPQLCREIDLGANRITDWSPLEDISTLITLTVYGNPVTESPDLDELEENGCQIYR